MLSLTKKSFIHLVIFKHSFCNKQINPCLYGTYVLKSTQSLKLIICLLCARRYARCWGIQWWQRDWRALFDGSWIIVGNWYWGKTNTNKICYLPLRTLQGNKICTNSCNPNEWIESVLSEENFLRNCYLNWILKVYMIWIDRLILHSKVKKDIGWGLAY